MPATITVTVEVAWTGALTGVFTLGTSELGGTDVLGGGFGNNVFDDITAYVRAVRTKRGRTDDLSQMQQGTCSITLKDATGRFNPENPTSPLAGYLLPLRPVKITAVHNSVTYGVFYGYIERIEHDPATRISTIDCVDFFEWLQATRLTFSPPGGFGILHVGPDGIEEVLDQIGWTDPTMRNIDTGRAISAFVLADDTPYLEQIADLVAYDTGVFFITGSGVVRFISGENYWKRQTTAGTLNGALTSNLRAAIDKQRIVNRQTCTASGGTAQTYTDEDSRRQYGYRDGAAFTSTYLASDAEALTRARFIVATRKDPSVPTRAVEVKAIDDTAAVQMLARDIGDQVALSETRGGTDTTVVIEGIEQEIAVDALPRTRFLVSKRRVNLFTLGTSVLSGPDILGW